MGGSFINDMLKETSSESAENAFPEVVFMPVAPLLPVVLSQALIVIAFGTDPFISASGLKYSLVSEFA